MTRIDDNKKRPTMNGHFRPLLFQMLLVFVIGFVIMLLGVQISAPAQADELTSPNYIMFPYNTGNSSAEHDEAGHAYKLSSEVGDVAVGTSLEGGHTYIINHGYLYPDGGVVLRFKVAPEKRVQNPPNGDANPNWDISDVRLQVRTVGTQNVVFETEVGPTNTDGEYLTDIPTVLPVGTYDLTVKGFSHLTLLKPSVTLISGTNMVDFSTDGSGNIVYMLAGDVNTMPSSIFGDDKVNSLDLGTIIPDLNHDVYKTDLNQDNKVNSLDLGMTITNLNMLGQ